MMQPFLSDFGRIAANALLERLDQAGFETHSKHLLDALTGDERAALFEALLLQARDTAQVRCGGQPDESRAMRLISRARYQVLPVLVVNPNDPGLSAQRDSFNRATEGFASALRDYYHLDAAKPRKLLLLTSRANETQKSAADSELDRKLLTAEGLASQLRRLYGLDSHEEVGKVVAFYLRRGGPQTGLSALLKPLNDFLHAVQTGPKPLGRHLPLLGGFIADPSPEAVDGSPLPFIPKGSAGRSRLESNAALHDYLQSTCRDVLKDPRKLLADHYPDEVIDRLLNADGLHTCSLEELVPEKVRHQGSINRFKSDVLKVRGATQVRELTLAEKPSRLVVVNARQRFTLTLELEKALDSAKENLLLLGPDARGKVGPLKKGVQSSGAREVTFELDPPGPFSVFRLSLTRGKRSTSKEYDGVLVVVYKQEPGGILFPHAATVDLEAQSWQVRSSRVLLTVQQPAARARSGATDIELDVDLENERSGQPRDAETDEDEPLELTREGLAFRIKQAVEDDELDDSCLDLLELAHYPLRGARGKEGSVFLQEALGEDGTYLSIRRASVESSAQWRVETGTAQSGLVRAYNDWGQEQAVAMMLAEPEQVSLKRQADGRIELQAMRLTEHPQHARLLLARRALFSALLQSAQRLLGSRSEQDIPSRIPWMLLDLQAHEVELRAYYDAWLDALKEATQREEAFNAQHLQLLSLDVLECVDERERPPLRRMVVLPTHPWLLSALLEFQIRITQDLRQRLTTSGRGRKEATQTGHLNRAEVEALIPHQTLEDWYRPQNPRERLRAVDGAPFCWEYLPASLYQLKAELEYVRRVVANKIERYLVMHPHLQDERRTLRLGFVNPGDGHQLLEGLRRWLSSKLPTGQEVNQDAEEQVLRQVPQLELVLFLGKREEQEEEASTFDDFFRKKLEGGSDKGLERLLLSRLRYGKREENSPQEGQYVHICFVQGLIRPERYMNVEADLSRGWDGCFGDGLLASSLRTTLPGTERNRLHSERGLWLAQGDAPFRRGLTGLMMLLRGAIRKDIRPGFGVHWTVELPTAEELRPFYQHSDWVVHLDRELSLELFHTPSSSDTDPPASRPEIIEYTDQEEPDCPGYDVITVTANAGPYLEQLDSVLHMADLARPDKRSHKEDKKAGLELLKVVNLLSGTWALDFLEGNLSRERHVNRLIGNVGAALVYRWLERKEVQALERRTRGRVVPLYISLEELIRATPSAGLPMSEGLRQRTRDKGHRPESYCDDLLILYLCPAEQDKKVRIFGRVIEVKFGKTASTRSKEAVNQVRETVKILQEELSGQHQLRSDAPFRNKQLSLLIKAQLDQEVAQGVLPGKRRDGLQTSLLSARLASGDYEVEYCLGHENQIVQGDVFLLDTQTPSPHESQKQDHGQVTVSVLDGVRVIRLSRAICEWLAYEEVPFEGQAQQWPSTLPYIGRFGHGLDTALGIQWPDVDEEDPDSGAIQAVSSSQSLNSEGTQAESRSPVLQAERSATAESLLPPAASPVQTDLLVSPASVALTAPSEPTPLPPAVRSEDTDSRSSSPAEPSPLPVPRAEVRPSGAALPAAVEPWQSAVRKAVVPEEQLVPVIQRLNEVLQGHQLSLESPASVREVDCGPRLVRAYVRLRAGESISNVRKISEDIARMVGTTSLDIHISNVPERRAIGLDLPIKHLGYEVTFDALLAHPSAVHAQQTLSLGFCAGIDVTGRAHWVDLETMPHMLVAGTTGSGKTVFLRTVLLTLIQHHRPDQLQLRLSSTKPMDFKPFERLPHAGGTRLADDASAALRLVEELVQEMDRRITLISDAICDNLAEYNADPSTETPLPRLVAVLDEYAETVLSFGDKGERRAFEDGVGRLAQKARAAGIHLILCMQRPDSSVIQGAIKANVAHRFALKLPQGVDSRVMLDENGAEALLGHGDLLYKDGSARLWRLQVPSLEKETFKRLLRG